MSQNELMPEIPTQAYIFILFALLISATFGFVAVSLSLRNANLPVASYPLFLAYFIVAGSGWLLFAVRDSHLSDLDITGSYVIYLACGALVHLAISEYWKYLRPLLFIVSVHLLLCSYTLISKKVEQNFYIIIIYGLLLYGHFAFLALRKALQEKNLGYMVIGLAGLLVVVLTPYELYALSVLHRLEYAYISKLISSASGFVLLGIGFLTSILIAEHKQLTLLALQDPLTSLLNRRGMEFFATQMLAVAKREGTNISAIVIDIDHFKQINDNYGHDVGDITLQQMATLLEDQTRASDLCCRFGGEEFVILLPGTSVALAKDIAERIRHTVESTEMHYAAGSINITVSLGVASGQGEVMMDALLSAADGALYKAKNDGRNRVACA